jgi:hypothetical protein
MMRPALHLALLQVVLAAEVASSPADRSEARAQGAALVRQLEAEGLRVLLPPPRAPAVDGPGGDPELSAQMVDAALAEARRQSEQFDESRALATLDRAETAYRRAPRVDIRPMLDILLLRARIQFDVGKTIAARESLRRAAALDPSLRLDPGEYEPRLLALWQSERKAAAKTQASLSVEGEGQVMIDGSQRGMAPQTLSLPAGEHFLALGVPGRMPVVEAVQLRVGESRTLKPPAPREPSRYEQRSAKTAELREAARAGGAQALVECRLRRGRNRMLLDARLIDVASGRVLASAMGPPEQIGSALASAMRPSTVEPAASTPAPSSKDESSTSPPLYARWWFWTIIGAAAAGSVAAVLTLRSSDRVDLVFHR